MANRVALVTGAGSGIGRAAARGLAKAGFDVVLAGRHADRLEAAAQDVQRAGAAAMAIAADVSSPKSVAHLFGMIRQELGRLDLLFNNAGTFVSGVPLDALTVEQWRSVVDVNLTGVFLCTQEAFRLFKAQTPSGGRIINNGSLSAHVPRGNSAAYTATKHAVWGLTKSTALDGRPFDIACGQIDVGNAATAMTSGLKDEPTIDPAIVADAVVYMASLPLSANVLNISVMATKMPYVGRG